MNSVWIGITTNRKITASDDPLIARMRAALNQPRLMPRHRQMLHFALGKAHDDRGEYEAAMRNFEEGNRLRGIGGRFDRESLARRVDLIIEATPPAFWDGSRDIGVEDATPLLIVGMPRSGSTLTEQILSSHPEVAAGGELGFWSSPQILSQDLSSLAGDAEAAKRVANDYIATLKAFDPAAKRVTDKALANFLPSRNHSPRAPPRHVDPLSAPSNRYSALDLHHELRNQLRLCVEPRRSRLLLPAVCAAHGSLAKRFACRSVHRGGLRGACQRPRAAVSTARRSLRSRVERRVSGAASERPQDHHRKRLAGAAADLSQFRGALAAIRAVAGRAPGVVS